MKELIIKLDTKKYKAPTTADLEAAKRFILDREQTAALLADDIDLQLDEAAEQIVKICYAYDLDPQKLYFSSAFNENLMLEISAVMDDLESRILHLIYDLSLKVEDDEDHAEELKDWMSNLGKGNKNLEDTLDTYLYKTMKDWEAAIAAMMYAKMSLSEAVTTIKTYKHAIYIIPAVVTAFKIADKFTATYIYSRGVQAGAIGISNNGSTNVVNMAKTTLQMTWMRSQAMDFIKQGAVGYYQLRGSNYNCDPCDEETGFYTDIGHLYDSPLVHPHCCCFRIPIYKLEKE